MNKQLEISLNENIDKRKIVFNKTSNIFLNSGIIALFNYLKEYKDNKKDELKVSLSENQLTVESNKLFDILEKVYYKMGKEIYDTSGKKAREKADKYYYIKEPFKAEPFFKMKTYGLAALLTNDPTATASKNGKKIKFDKLIKEDRKFALLIAKDFREKVRKLKFYSWEEGILKEKPKKDDGKRTENTGGESEIFINESYTKIPKISFDKIYLKKGDKKCYLTGESYMKLVEITNTSPFLAGLNNFESFAENSTRQFTT